MQRSVHFDFSPSQPKIPVSSPQRTEYSFKRNVTYHEHYSNDEKKKNGLDLVKGTNIMKVNRKQIKDIHDWVESSLQKERDTKLAKKQLSQTNSDIELFKKQIEVLSSAMEKLVIVTKEQCIEQADLMDRLWKSAFELHDRVHKFTNTAINKLRCEQMDNVLLIRKLKHQVKLLKLQPEIRTSSTKSQQARYDEQPSSEESRAEVAALTAELLLKDQELLGLHHTIAQLSVWFPQFPVYSQSLLSKLLPPVKRSDQLSSEYSQVTPDRILLQDLRRLEEIGIGFKVVHPEDTIAEQGHLDTNLEDDSMTKASIASSNNSIVLELNLPKLPAYESHAELNDNVVPVSHNPSNLDHLQPSIVTIENISRSHSLGDLSFSQSIANGNESFKLLLTISLEQEQKIIALKKELDELKSRHYAEASALQAEIGHLNAALSIQRGKPKPGNYSDNSHLHRSIDSQDTQTQISSQNYVNMLSFVRRNPSIGSVVAIQNDHGTAIPVSKTSSNFITISQIHGYLIDFMRFTTTHPDRGFNEIFGTGSLDSRTSVAIQIPILPGIHAFHFENKMLRSIKTWNPYVVIRLLKYFSFELEDCKGGQAMAESLLLSLLHILRDSPAFTVHYQHFLSELFGLPNKAGRDPTVNVYSLKHESQRDFRSYLYVSVFDESFKAMQAFITNKVEAGRSNFPLPMTSRILYRIFDVRNSSFDSSNSFESSKVLGHKWWLCLTSRLLDDLKLKVEMTAFHGNLDLTTDHQHGNNSDIPTVNCYSCLYFCWQYVQLLHTLWSNILAGVYTYLVSVIPSSASSQQFHLLLASILEHPYLFSSLSTSPNRRNGEDSNGNDITLLSPSQPSLSKSLHEPDPPTVNATLVDELMSLAAADNLNNDSFADAILRANCSTLVRSLGHLVDPYYFNTAEESSSLWNSHEEDIHLEGRLLMAELQSLCEEHFPVGLSSSLIGVGGSTESESMNKNSYEYKIHKMNISCRRQLHLPAGVSTHTASPSLFSSSGSRADLSIQLSEPSLASGTSYAASSIHSHTPKRSSQLDAKAIKLRRSYFKESVLASKVLYPKEVDVPMTTAAVPPPEDQDDDYNYNYTEAHSEPEADSLQVEYFSQVLSFAERILLQARQCFNPHFVKVKKPSKLDVTLTLMTMRYYIGVSRKVRAKMTARNSGPGPAEQSGGAVSPTRRSNAYTAAADFNNSNSHTPISLLSSLIVGNHGDWYKYQKAVFFGRRKSMNTHFRAWAMYSVSQFSQDD